MRIVGTWSPETVYGRAVSIGAARCPAPKKNNISWRRHTNTAVLYFIRPPPFCRELRSTLLAVLRLPVIGLGQLI